MKDELRNAFRIVALLNLVYFGVAITTWAVSLFADSIDFLEDASVKAVTRAPVIFEFPKLPK
jgi:Co/Zn/Cd efflux system component